jgi:hypothetical protein
VTSNLSSHGLAAALTYWKKLARIIIQETLQGLVGSSR